MGFFDHMLPAGIVPVEVRDALNSSCVLLSPPQRRMDGPTKSSGIFWNVFSVKGSPAGARRYEYPPVLVRGMECTHVIHGILDEAG